MSGKRSQSKSVHYHHSHRSNHAGRRSERGNALIYVLIAVVLFGALSFTLSRQTDTSEVGTLENERAELIATQLISYAADAKSAFDKMQFTGTRVGDVNVIPPSDPDFNSATTSDNLNKIFHPEGGGLNFARIPDRATDASNITTPDDPAPGWYMGFNQVEWTPSTDTDLILTAYGLAPLVCGFINEKITGNTTIPVISDSVKETLVQKTIDGEDMYSVGANVDLTTDPDATSPAAICPECHNQASLCVQEGGVFGFYTIIGER